MKKYLFLLSLILITFLTACEFFPNQKTFELAKNSYTMIVGETIDIEIEHSKNIEFKLINENPELLSISDLSINALEVGSAIITIEVDGKIYHDYITVNILQKLEYSILAPLELLIGEEVELKLLYNNLEVEDVVYVLDNSSLASLQEDNTLVSKEVGTIKIDAFVEDELVATISIEIKYPEDYILKFDIDYSALVGEVRTLVAYDTRFPVSWESSDEDVATIDESGQITFLNEGLVTISLSPDFDPNSNFSVEILVTTKQNNTIIVDASIDSSSETSFYYDDTEYYKGINLFASLREAIDASVEGSIIYLVAGVYKENIDIVLDNISLISSNKSIFPNDENRKSEAIIEGTINIVNKVSGLTINGLAFTKTAKIIVLGEARDFAFMYNKIYDTNLTAAAWTELETYTGGFMRFVGGGANSSDIIIEANSFTNLGDAAVNFASINTVKVINNEFDIFKRDAIRISNGQITKTSHWLFMDNVFKNGDYNGIYFRTYAASVFHIENIISIFNNEFENLGIKNVQYSGAISFRNYQEGAASINISYNSFKDGNNYIFLRNNAKVDNQVNFKAFINYNLFTGIPSSYYLKNKNTSDTSKLNPSNINMDNNFYADSLGQAINLASNQSKFDGASTNIPLATKAALLNSPKVYGSNIVRIDSSPTMNVDDEVEFSSSNNTIFTVNSEGKINPLKEGSATLYVKKGTYKTSFPIIVSPSVNIDYISLLLQIAIAEEGYREGTNNDTKYGTWYGMPNQPWCAMFVSWAAHQANIPISIIPKYASVQIGMEWFQTYNRFEEKGSYIPKAGDLLFLKSDGASHTAIVISSDGERVYTIEGNTSDMVAKRSYPLNYSKITGYGIPNYPPFDGEPYDFDITGATSGDGHSTR